MGDGEEFGGVFVFEVGVTVVFVAAEVFFPLVETVEPGLFFLVSLCGEKGVDNDLASGRCGGWWGNGLEVLMGLAEYVANDSKAVDRWSVVGKLKFGVENFEFA